MMMRPPATNHVSFSISGITAWAPGVTTDSEWQEYHRGLRPIECAGEPGLQQMPPLLRRHAGRLGRLACSVAYDALAGNTDVPVVFSSRYGEVSRSVDLLNALAAREELSPASFGLSVHNAIAGLFSMARKDTANSISLAAGDDSAEYGAIEACSLLADGRPKVLLVVADVPLPDVYSAYEDSSPDAFAWACLLQDSGPNRVRLEWSDSSAAAVSARNIKPSYGQLRNTNKTGALEALSFLQGDRAALDRHSGPRQWRWQRNG